MIQPKYALSATPTDQEKERVWAAYRAGRPVRVPVTLATNPRVVVLDPAFNPEGYTFEQAANDPRVHVMVSLKHQLYLRTELSKYCDSPASLPERWDVGLYVYNVYEAACLGARVRYPPGQVPDTEPFLTEANREDIFKVDVENALEIPFIKARLAFWREMEKVCDGLIFEGRPVMLHPWANTGTDGPLTVACNVRGTEFLMELVSDEDYARRLMDLIVRATLARRRAFKRYWGERITLGNWMADDCCQMVSVDQYRKMVMPFHRRLYENMFSECPRSLHMCGKASHLFPTIRRELNVTGFDTGFPVDHGRLRRELGPDVEIQGGTEVALLLQGSPEQVFTRTRDILLSGVMEGGRFVLRDGNNLPPRCPSDNLRAFYAACLEYGWYDHAERQP